MSVNSTLGLTDGAKRLLLESLIRNDRQEELTMTISIRVRGIEWSDELRKQVERSVEFAVDRYHAHVSHVLVYLMDLNGPKGGADKLCQITAELRRSNAVLILEKGAEVVPTVHRAVGRLRYQIGRSIQRCRRPSGHRREAYERVA
jgi:putative sigma-54 modulation protein